MFKLFVLIFVTIAVCEANIQVAPPVACGRMPESIYECMGSPGILKLKSQHQCNGKTDECQKITCLFNQNGWLNGDKLDKEKLIAHFDQYAKNNPGWESAVQNLKVTCLTTDLPAQGIYLNCPAYDTLFCFTSSVIKGAQPSQWSSSTECQYPRQFAAACPVCPDRCFAPQIPIGSCNACLALPRSP